VQIFSVEMLLHGFEQCVNSTTWQILSGCRLHWDQVHKFFYIWIGKLGEWM